jgi:hypothetical protein
MFAGCHVGTIEACRTGRVRGRTAAISVIMSAASTLSGRRRYGSRSDSQRRKRSNDENLSHDSPPSRCVIAYRLVFSGLKWDPTSMVETAEGSVSEAIGNLLQLHVACLVNSPSGWNNRCVSAAACQAKSTNGRDQGEFQACVFS